MIEELDVLVPLIAGRGMKHDLVDDHVGSQCQARLKRFQRSAMPPRAFGPTVRGPRQPTAPSVAMWCHGDSPSPMASYRMPSPRCDSYNLTAVDPDSTTYTV